VSVIHLVVCAIVREHICLRKTESKPAGDGFNGGRCQLSKESDDTLFWYCVSVLQCMIKLWKKTLAGKKGWGDLSKQVAMIIVQALLPCVPPSEDCAIVAGKEN